jgi:pimeloyl-ACP methyl ester carboxylesterase
MKPQIQGQGDLIIFLNGGGFGQWMWKDVVSQLKGFKTLTFDYDGYAGEPGTFISMDKEIEKVLGYINEFRSSERIFLVGHSLGAQILLKLIQDDRRNDYGIQKGIAISALNIPRPKLLKHTLSMSKLVMPLTQKRWFAKLNARSFRLPDKLFDMYFEDTKVLNFEWLSNIMKENMTFHVSIQDPAYVSILVGEKEIKLMRDSAQTLSIVSKAIRGAGHDIPFNYPGVVIEEIYNFFGNSDHFKKGE